MFSVRSRLTAEEDSFTVSFDILEIKMKKFLIVFALFFAVFMVSCGSGKEETPETGDTDGSSQSDTAQEADETDTADTGDTVPVYESDDADAGENGGDNDQTETENDNEPADTGDIENGSDDEHSDTGDIENSSDNDPADTEDTENDNDSDDADDADVPDCVPQCDGTGCGDDGCGGTCLCGHDQGCNDEFKCVDLDFSGCTGLSVDWSKLVLYSMDSFYAVGSGGSDPRATIQFYQDLDTHKITAGTYDLGSGRNLQYKTCSECVFVYSDMFINASGSNEYAKKYFQHDGTLTISSVDEDNRIKGTLTARIFEATFDKKLMMNFVAGGKCFKIESVVLDTQK